MQEKIGLIAGYVSAAGYILYCLTTMFPNKIWGQTTKPNRATWWILTLVGGVLAESYYCSGADTTMPVAISYFLGPLAISLIALNPKWGTGGWENGDKMCLLLALLCLTLRVNFPEYPRIALVMIIIADLVGLWPTIVKSYWIGESEDRYAWAVSSFACFINLFAVTTWSTWEIWVPPIYLFVFNSIVVILLFRNEWCHKILNIKSSLKPS